MSTKEELAALFGTPPQAPVEDDPFADIATPAAMTTEHLAAVLPPDAPPSSKDTPPPAKAKGKARKASKVIDVAAGETEEQAEARAKGNCGYCGDTDPKDDHADTCTQRRVNPLSIPKPPAMSSAPGALHHMVVELGPKTLAILEALVKALSK